MVQQDLQFRSRPHARLVVSLGVILAGCQSSPEEDAHESGGGAGDGGHGGMGGRAGQDSRRGEGGDETSRGQDGMAGAGTDAAGGQAGLGEVGKDAGAADEPAGGNGGQGAGADAGTPVETDTFTLQGFLACVDRVRKEARAAKVAAGGVYQPVCDMINFEVEDAPAGNGWTKETMIPGFSGTSYYRFTGGGGVLRYRFHIARAGKYSVFFHNRHEHPDLTLENDCFTSFDGGAKVKTGGGGAKVWNWQLWFEFVHEMHEAAVLDLSVGVHTLEISGRSTGYAIDRITIRPDNTRAAIYPRLEYPLSSTQ